MVFHLPRSGCLGTPVTLPQSLYGRTDGRTETELNNDERSAVRNAGDRARTLSKPGGLFKMAGICGIFPYGKQTRWLSTVLHG